MKKYILIVAILFSCLVSISCKKFLEEQSQTDIIPRSITTLNELLLGEGYPRAYKTLNLRTSFFDDDKEQIKAFSGTKASYYPYTWQPDQEQKLGSATIGTPPWGIYYRMLQICNVTLDYAGKVTGDQAEKDDVTGQAYLLRAFYYFKLVNLYGKPYTDKLSIPEKDLGVPLILQSGVSLDGKPRNTVKEVYQQILDDMDKGTSLLEKNKKNNGIYRINYIAGYLFASRVHLSMGNWAKAIEASSKVLDIKANLADLPHWGPVNRDTKPIIDGSNPEVIWAFGATSDVSDPSSNADENNYELSPTLLSLYENGDLRRTIYIAGKRSIKRPNPTYFNLKVGQGLRVSEALLNRAEAYAQLYKQGIAANGALALNDLNTLRQKRFDPALYVDLTTTDADDLLQKCYDEKRREFFLEEEHRWFDLRRHGMPSITHYNYDNATQRVKYTLLDHDPAYLMQIPDAALALNPQLINNPKPPIRFGQ